MCTTNTACVEQSVIVTHEKMTLYLLKGIKHYTDKNQKRSTSEELCKLTLYAKEACEGGKDGDECEEQ